jgi:hypothetical protein
MVVQREDTTRMGTILLEEVYQGFYVKLESSKTVVGWYWVRSEAIWGSRTLGEVMYVDTQAFQVQVRSTHGIKSWSMGDSHENLYIMEKNFVVN